MAVLMADSEPEIWSRAEGFVAAHSPRYSRPYDVPLTLATPQSLTGFGEIVTDFTQAEVRLEPWPTRGPRGLCAGTGSGGGIKEGDFEIRWDGDQVRACNVAAGEVGHDFVTGRLPQGVSPSNRTHVLVRDTNYHPDGGQVFYSVTPDPFVLLLGHSEDDDVKPSDFTAFYFDGGCGLQIAAGVWHQSPYPLGPSLTFHNKQSAVYACVMVDFVHDFGQYLRVPLTKP